MTKFDILGARIVIQALCRQAEVPVGKILRRRTGYPRLTRLRAAIARELCNAGFSYPEVGELIKRDHSTVQTLVKGRKR